MQYRKLPINGNQKTTHYTNKIMENISNIINIKELSEGLFPININN